MKLLILLAAAAAMAASISLAQPAAEPKNQPARQTTPKPAEKSALQPAAKPAEPARKPEFRVLVFSKTAGFRHDCIPDGIAAVQKLGTENNFAVDATEDSAKFTADNLDQYAAVIFLCTTLDILDADQQKAFEAYIGKARGYVGIHSAADTEYEWPWYGHLVGAYFKTHPAIQEAMVHVEDRSHPSTTHLPEQWKRTDEWYDYKQSPREQVHVLMSLDEKSYKNATMNGDHPIAWCHEFGGGRAWYTGGGHTKESYAEPEFLKHVLGGIRWAAGKADWKPQAKPAATHSN